MGLPDPLAREPPPSRQRSLRSTPSSSLWSKRPRRAVAALGIRTDAASTLLVTAGDNTERLGHEATFAHLCGASPIEASSGKNQRHRLHRSGDRQANSALWQIGITRMVF